MLSGATPKHRKAARELTRYGFWGNIALRYYICWFWCSVTKNAAACFATSDCMILYRARKRWHAETEDAAIFDDCRWGHVGIISTSFSPMRAGIWFWCAAWCDAHRNFSPSPPPNRESERPLLWELCYRHVDNYRILILKRIRWLATRLFRCYRFQPLFRWTWEGVSKISAGLHVITFGHDVSDIPLYYICTLNFAENGIYRSARRLPAFSVE